MSRSTLTTAFHWVYEASLRFWLSKLSWDRAKFFPNITCNHATAATHTCTDACSHNTHFILARPCVEFHSCLLEGKTMPVTHWFTSHCCTVDIFRCSCSEHKHNVSSTCIMRRKTKFEMSWKLVAFDRFHCVHIRPKLFKLETASM